MIAFTYDEPAVYFEYAYDTAKLAHAAGLCIDAFDIKVIPVVGWQEGLDTLKK